MRAPLVQIQRQVACGKHVHGAPHRPAFHKALAPTLLCQRLAAADAQRVERAADILRLQPVQFAADGQLFGLRGQVLAVQDAAQPFFAADAYSHCCHTSGQ